MTFPTAPPDPTDEEVEDDAALVGLAGQLADFAAQLDLTPAQRRKLNNATRLLAEADEHLAEARRRQAKGL